MRPLLSFVAILKNEASNIRTTLESVRPYVDRWTVLDTGSTDGTQEIVREVMQGIPGSLHEEPFVDFATSRNRALELDAWELTRCDEIVPAAVFSLMLSGDETLEGGTRLREELEARREQPDGAYCVEMSSGPRIWPYSRVLRTGTGWKYVGKVHERPIGPNGEVHAQLIPGVRVVHAPSDPERKVKRLREFDLPTLTAVVENDEWTLDERAHAMMFLAETYAALSAEYERQLDGQHVPGDRWLSYQMAAMALYWRYSQIAELAHSPAYDFDKAMYAKFMYFHIADVVGLYTSQELVARLHALVEIAPAMPEARFLLARHATRLDPRQGLFLALEAARVAREVRERPSYQVTDERLEWLSLRVAAECARVLKKSDQARDLAERARVAGAPPEALEGLL